MVMYRLRLVPIVLILLPLLWYLVSVSSIGINGASLYHLLDSVEYLNNGTISNGDEYGYSYRHNVMYGEPENVTTVNQSWGIGGPFPILYKSDKRPIPPICTLNISYPGQDMPGGDLSTIVLDKASVDQCQAFCCHTNGCVGFVVAIADSNFKTCHINDACCYMKSSITPLQPSNQSQIVSGTITTAIDPLTIAAPTGMRSAVPIGGISCGSIDLRADGTFHEWTIVNQSPGGSAKYGVVGEAVMGLRLAGDNSKNIPAITRLIRTTPPKGLPGIDQIKYRGSYPVSRLDIMSQDIPIMTTIYAYSRFRVGDLNHSATPAFILSANLHNPSNSIQTISFFFNVPFGVESDQQRLGGTSYVIVNIDTPVECMHRCDMDDQCMSWTWQAGICYNDAHVIGNAYQQHSYSGVKGRWSWSSSYEAGTTTSTIAASSPLIHTRPGSTAASGDIALWPSVSSSDGSSTGYEFSVGVSDDLTSLYYDFDFNGRFSLLPSGLRSAQHGAAGITVTLQPGQNATASIILSWYFPNRDHVGLNIGNFYQHLFTSAMDVGRSILGANNSVDGLSNIMNDILSLHTTYFDSNLPEYLVDNLINSVSHMRSAIYAADGRWRQWEAYDCVDIDSVHNDYQRHMPYILYFPETEKHKMRAHAQYQQQNGMINEELTQGCGGDTYPWDDYGGRAMADVTNLWITEIYQIYAWTNDIAFVKELYPHVINATMWEISVSPTGLPERLVDTYDIIGLDVYRLDVFNSVLHLLGMKAAMALSRIMKDDVLYSAAQSSYNLGYKMLNDSFWNSTGQYYRSYWNNDPTIPPNVIFADSLYGQVISYTLGLGDLLPRSQMLSHIIAEEQHNDSPYGLIVQTGREDYHNNQDNAIWMGGSQDWTTLALRFGLPPTDIGAYRQAAKGMNNWRYRLNDIWNVWGLVGGIGIGMDGYWWTTSHYGFHMVLWHTPFAVTNQLYYAPNQTLSFAPIIPIPYKLPIMIPNVLGILTANNQTQGTITYRLTINTGTITLSTLTVSGSNAPTPGTLHAGQYIEWQAKIQTTTSPTTQTTTRRKNKERTNNQQDQNHQHHNNHHNDHNKKNKKNNESRKKIEESH